MVCRSLIKETVSFFHIHLNPIHLKYTYISKLPDFIRVQSVNPHWVDLIQIYFTPF